MTNQEGVGMIGTQLIHVTAASKYTSHRELRLLVGRQVFAITILIQIRSFDVKSTKPASQSASLLDARSELCVVAIIYQVFALRLRAVPEFDACLFRIEARPIISPTTALPILRHANETGHWTCYSHGFAIALVVAIFLQVWARSMLQEPSFCVNFEPCVLGGNITTNA
jgi:hypothetical protein